MNFDVVPGLCDVANDPRERKAAQVTMAEPRDLRGIRADHAGGIVTLISIENRTQLAGEQLFELLFRTYWVHVPSLLRERRHGRVERLQRSTLSCTTARRDACPETGV